MRSTQDPIAGLKQKTAYEIRLSLVGSEMCIRDRDVLSTLVVVGDGGGAVGGGTHTVLVV